MSIISISALYSSLGVNMTAVLNAGQQGNPLLVFAEHDFTEWLKQQPESTQHWLKAVNFKKGIQLIPGQNGASNTTVFVTKDLTNFFACGDLDRKSTRLNSSHV